MNCVKRLNGILLKQQNMQDDASCCLLCYICQPAALLLLLHMENVRDELLDVVSSESCQLTEFVVLFSAAPLQQLHQTAVVAINFVPLFLMPSSTPLQPLSFLLRAQKELTI